MMNNRQQKQVPPTSLTVTFERQFSAKNLHWKKHLSVAGNFFDLIRGGVENSTEDQFVRDELVQYAVQRLFEVMGEGCARLNPEVLPECGEIPSKGLKDLRNILIHK